MELMQVNMQLGVRGIGQVLESLNFTVKTNFKYVTRALLNVFPSWWGNSEFGAMVKLVG